MGDLPESRPSFSAICPFLRSHHDPQTAYAYPNPANRCYCPGGPKSLDIDRQATYCLGPGHNQCSFYVARQEAWSRYVNRADGKTGNIQDRRDGFGRAVRDIGLLLQGGLHSLRSGAESAWTILQIRGIKSLAGIGLTLIIILMLAAPYLIEASAKSTRPTEISSLGSIARPTSTVPPRTGPQAGIELGPRDTPVTESAGGITLTSTPTLTEVPSSTSLPTATATPSPVATATVTRAAILLTKSTATATLTPIGVTPTGHPLYAAPLLLDPPDGMGLRKNTILRWSSDHVLNPNEVFDVLVWHEGMTQVISIGDTTETIFPLDFRSWRYTGYSGRFFWTIQIQVVGGGYLSSAGPPFSFIVDESIPPGSSAAPPPTSAPPAPQPTRVPPQPSPPPP